MKEAGDLRLSIIIVSWNAKAYLEECLTSLVSQLDPKTSEIIVVDNASNDGSPELVNNDFPTVKLFQTGQNLGFAKANNFGFRHAGGQYVCLINSDVIVSEGCLQAMMSYMDEHTSIGLLGPKILNADLTIQDSCKEFPSLWNTLCRALALDALFPKWKIVGGHLMRYFAHDLTQDVDVLSGCFCMARRCALEQVGPLDEGFFMYAEDKDWSKRFWDAGWRLVYFADVASIHFGGASSSHQPVRFYVEMNRANLRYWRKHYGRSGQFLFRLLMLLHESLRVVAGGALWLLSRDRRNEHAFKCDRSIACIRSLLAVPGFTPVFSLDKAEKRT